ncbi:hypothetical protein HPB48_008326 [Haemaphysalis longicornis]|uniref:Carboxylesterase type B domain-containing protein n=1 Tax=Haemaphysalis longicornis TaxID=44386 RepID=A0A9J6FIQ8_HAELO|nr:hypothetical protein HPB48_008326 [Haemaphysalis longicornis]
MADVAANLEAGSNVLSDTRHEETSATKRSHGDEKDSRRRRRRRRHRSPRLSPKRRSPSPKSPRSPSPELHPRSVDAEVKPRRAAHDNQKSLEQAAPIDVQIPTEGVAASRTDAHDAAGNPVARNQPEQSPASPLASEAEIPALKPDRKTTDDATAVDAAQKPAATWPSSSAANAAAKSTQSTSRRPSLVQSLMSKFEPRPIAPNQQAEIDAGRVSEGGFLDGRVLAVAIASLLVVFLILRVVQAPRYSNVATRSGTLIGVHTRTKDGVAVRRFLGIPYAKSTAGEWFESGSNSDHDWAELAGAADAVVVSINHRLGVMGFFSPDFSDMVPDAGFEDVLLAVDWVRRNAGAFNADPGELVALGHGSGAYLLSLVLGSRKHHEGFRRALLQGLFPTAPLSRNTAAMTQSYMHKMALILECKAPDILAELACLRAAPQERLVDAARQLYLPLRFVPTGHRIADSLNDMNFGDGVKVVLGSTISLGVDFVEKYLKPYVMPRDNVSGAEALLDSVCMFLKNGSDLRAAVGKARESQLEWSLARVWSVCSSRAMTAAATQRRVTAYNYVTAVSEGFYPPFSLQDVAAFVSKG